MFAVFIVSVSTTTAYFAPHIGYNVETNNVYEVRNEKYEVVEMCIFLFRFVRFSDLFPSFYTEIVLYDYRSEFFFWLLFCNRSIHDIDSQRWLSIMQSAMTLRKQQRERERKIAAKIEKIGLQKKKKNRQ